MNLKSASEIITEILFSGMHSVGIIKACKKQRKKGSIFTYNTCKLTQIITLIKISHLYII